MLCKLPLPAKEESDSTQVLLGLQDPKNSPHWALLFLDACVGRLGSIPDDGLCPASGHLLICIFKPQSQKKVS